MKITIHELLGMIKDKKAPKKIKYLDKVYRYIGEDYEDEEENQLLSWLFRRYCVDYILSVEVEIIETTITYNQDNYYQYQPYTGEVEIKCNSALNLLESEQYNIENNKQDKIEKLVKQGMTKNQKKIVDKINEIIDRLNNE